MGSLKSVIILLLYGAVISLISFICAYEIGRESRFSTFFDNDLQRFVLRERQSEVAASNYLATKKEGFPLWSVHKPVDNPFCITIMTKKRPFTNYVARSAGYLLHRLEILQHFYYNYSLPIRAFISNGERPKTNHDILATFGNAIDVVHLEDVSAMSSQQAVNVSVHHRNDSSHHLTDVGTALPIPFEMINRSFRPSLYIWKRNEILDSSLILDYSDQLGCEYLMILEDDGIVSRLFYPKIVKALDQLNSLSSNSSTSTRTSPNYFALKLFYSDTFSGWSIEWFDMILLTVSTGFLAIIFAYIIPRMTKIATTKRSTAILLIHFWLFYVLLFLAVGKQSIFPPFRGHQLLKLQRQMGATVGVVYPRAHFKGLSTFLKAHVRRMDNGHDVRFVDQIIDDYADEVLNLDTYLLLPNVVQHVGRYSSATIKNQGSLRSMSTSNSFPKSDEVFEILSPHHFMAPQSNLVDFSTR